MLLTGPEIETQCKTGKLKIDPFNAKHVGANSYDVVLAADLRVYQAQLEWLRYQATPVNAERVGGSADRELLLGYGYSVVPASCILDPEQNNPTISIEIPDDEDGLILLPGITYIGSTIEWTVTQYPLAPMLEGRSTWGRLGVSVHQTAGVGDVGFRGNWVLELSVQSPVRVRRNRRVAQILFHTVYGAQRDYTGTYQDQHGCVPARPADQT